MDKGWCNAKHSLPRPYHSFREHPLANRIHLDLVPEYILRSEVEFNNFFREIVCVENRVYSEVVEWFERFLVRTIPYRNYSDVFGASGEVDVHLVQTWVYVIYCRVCSLDPFDPDDVMTSGILRKFLSSVGTYVAHSRTLTERERSLCIEWNAVVMSRWNHFQNTTLRETGDVARIKLMEVSAVLSLEMKHLMYEFEKAHGEEHILVYMRSVYRNLFVKDVFVSDLRDLTILLEEPFAEGVSPSKNAEDKDSESKVSDDIKKSGGLWNWVTQKFQSIYESITGFFIGKKNAVYQFANDMMRKVIQFFVESIDPDKKLQSILDDLQKKVQVKWSRILYVGVVLVVCVGFSIGIIGTSVVKTLLSYASFQSMPIAEGDNDVFSVLVTGLAFMSTSMFNIPFKQVRNYLFEISSCLNSAKTIGSFCVSVLSMLPGMVKGVLARFLGIGKKEYTIKEAMKLVAEWNALDSLSMVEHVAGTDYYSEKLNNLIWRMNAMMTELAGAGAPPSVMSTLGRALSDAISLNSQFMAFQYQDSKRPFPLWIHYYGKPGIGKSVMVDKVIPLMAGKWYDPYTQKVADRPLLPYYRNSSDQYWSGYNPNRADVVVFDEFANVYQSGQLEKIFLEMLCLCSCAPFPLNNATVNASYIGWKGLHFRSPILLTLNNSYGIGLQGNLANGIYRRRNIVIETVPHPDYEKYFVASKIDGEPDTWKLPEDEQEKLFKTGEYLQFNIRVGVGMNGIVQTLTGYAELAAYILVYQKEFHMRAIKLLGLHGRARDPKKTVDQAIKDALEGKVFVDSELDPDAVAEMEEDRAASDSELDRMNDEWQTVGQKRMAGFYWLHDGHYWYDPTNDYIYPAAHPPTATCVVMRVDLKVVDGENQVEKYDKGYYLYKDYAAYCKRYGGVVPPAVSAATFEKTEGKDRQFNLSKPLILPDADDLKAEEKTLSGADLEALKESMRISDEELKKVMEPGVSDQEVKKEIVVKSDGKIGEDDENSHVDSLACYCSWLHTMAYWNVHGTFPRITRSATKRTVFPWKKEKKGYSVEVPINLEYFISMVPFIGCTSICIDHSCTLMGCKHAGGRKRLSGNDHHCIYVNNEFVLVFRGIMGGMTKFSIDEDKISENPRKFVLWTLLDFLKISIQGFDAEDGYLGFLSIKRTNVAKAVGRGLIKPMGPTRLEATNRVEWPKFELAYNDNTHCFEDANNSDGVDLIVRDCPDVCMFETSQGEPLSVFNYTDLAAVYAPGTYFPAVQGVNDKALSPVLVDAIVDVNEDNIRQLEYSPGIQTDVKRLVDVKLELKSEKQKKNFYSNAMYTPTEFTSASEGDMPNVDEKEKMKKNIVEVQKWCESSNDKVVFDKSGLIDLDASEIYFDVSEDIWDKFVDFYAVKCGIDVSIIQSFKEDLVQRMRDISSTYDDAGRNSGIQQFDCPIDSPSDGAVFLQYMAQFAGYAAGVAGTIWLIRKVRSMLTGDAGDDQDYEVVAPVAEARDTSPEPNLERKTSLVRRVARYPGAPATMHIAEASAARARVLRFRHDKFSFIAIGVQNDYYLTFSHLEHALDLGRDVPLTVDVNGRSVDCTLVKDSVVALEDKDCLLFRLNGNVGFSPNIVNSFVTLEEAGRLAKSVTGWNINAVLHEVEMQSVARYCKVYSYCLPTTYERVEFLDGIAYPAASRDGDCGTPLMAQVGDQQKILAIHVAGQNMNYGKRGFGQIVTSEDVSYLLRCSAAREKDGQYPVTEAKGEMDVNGYGDNFKFVESVPVEEQVFVPEKQTYELSPVGQAHCFEIKREPSIVSKFDPRNSDHHDPLSRAFFDLSFNDQVEITADELKLAKQSLLSKLRSEIDFHGFDRELTIEEAIGGVPGLLSSMNLSSSAGYPLALQAKTTGKKQWAHFDDQGDLVITDEFRQIVKDYRCDLENGVQREFYFLAFPKAELQKKSKIEQGKTRAIYSGAFEMNVVARMKFGCLLIALNNNHHEFAITINQYSYDMNEIAEYLTFCKDALDHIIAGDFGNFDQHTQKPVQKAVYDILFELLPTELQDSVAWDQFVRYQTESGVQYRNQRFYFEVAHLSGCLFTTIGNILTNSLYMRIMFNRLYPHLEFDKCVRACFCGDDHVMSVDVEKAPLFNQNYLIQNFSKLGQVYTDDQKNTFGVPAFRKFSEISFLGATPIYLSKGWCGRMRKDTLEQAVSWMKNGIEDWYEATVQYVSLYTMYPRVEFNHYLEKINLVLDSIHLPKIDVAYETRQIIASQRSVLGVEAAVAESMTAFSEDPIFTQDQMALPMPVEGSGFGGGDVRFEEGMDSFLYKTSFQWTISQSNGTDIATYNLPFDLLRVAQGDMQTTKFRQMTFYRSDLEVRVQTNGTALQYGCLLMQWLPLCDKTRTLQTVDDFAVQHLAIAPKNSGDLVMRIPFRTNYQFLPVGKNFGSLRFRVRQKLTYTSGSPITVSLFLRFVQYDLKVPRPLVSAFAEMESEALQNSTPAVPVETVQDSAPQEAPPEAQPPTSGDDKPKKKRSRRSKLAQLAHADRGAYMSYQARYFHEHGEFQTSGSMNPLYKGIAVSPEYTKYFGDAEWVAKADAVGRGLRGNSGYNKTRRWNAKQKKKVSVSQGTQKRGGRKFWGRARKSSQKGISYSDYVKKFGERPAVTEKEVVVATRRGWSVLSTETGQVVRGPKNFCKNLLQDVFEGVTDLIEGLGPQVEKLMPTVGAISSMLGFLDNPFVCDDGTRVVSAFPRMSNVTGPHITTTMQQAPAAIYRPGRLMMDPSEMNIDFLVGREQVLWQGTWSQTQVSGDLLLAIDLNSWLDINGKHSVGCSTYFLNLFQFFHAVPTFHVYVFKTMFHTGRLRAVFGYGEYDVDATKNYGGTGYTHILDYTVEDVQHSFTAEWMAPTDYLRTFDGPRVADPTWIGKYDFSLGTLRLEVLNQLAVAQETVPVEVGVLVSVTFDDVRVAIPKPYPLINAVNSGRVPTISFTGAIAEMDVTGSSTILPPDEEVDEPFVDADDVSETEPGAGPEHSNLDIGAQFEFLTGNVLDLLRRYVSISPALLYMYAPTGSAAGINTWHAADSKLSPIVEIVVTPAMSAMTAFYRGFCGGIDYRIYCPGGIKEIFFTPSFGGRQSLALANYSSSVTNTVKTGSSITSTISLPTNVFNTTLTTSVPVEVSYPLHENLSWIDVTVPYEQHVGYMTPETSGDPDGIIILGVLSFKVPDGAADLKVYQKFSDDASLGIYVPPQSYQAAVTDSVTGTIPEGTVGLAGYYW
ncbi:hypothetical protein [Jingmen picorna-like virus]|uniref:hypothetical protein n=1 Tax=Jingmen picorna-like virus TaxID=1923350 RepID=UPI00090971BE|nr:hypothetical protein [Jingmen picorna-like virus]APG77948.1 hypothetical protein [Jingmen picorna-like virus]